MTPITPKPVSGWHSVTFAKDQEEYQPLPALVIHDPHNTMRVTVSCWSLSWQERLRIFLGQPLWHEQTLGVRDPLQPIRLSVGKEDWQAFNP